MSKQLVYEISNYFDISVSARPAHQSRLITLAAAATQQRWRRLLAPHGGRVRRRAVHVLRRSETLGMFRSGVATVGLRYSKLWTCQES